jgi:hypothetical protein
MPPPIEQERYLTEPLISPLFTSVLLDTQAVQTHVALLELVGLELNSNGKELEKLVG